jgi:hypothetical protein
VVYRVVRTVRMEKRLCADVVGANYGLKEGSRQR